MTHAPSPDGQTVTDPHVVVADQVIDTLVQWGVTEIFTCPGSTEAAFLHAAAARGDLQVRLTTHESIAVAMADGHARATGRPSVAYLHANVGLTNGLSHLYAAQLAHSPVVVLTGLKQTTIQGRGGFTTASHIRDFVRQYCKWTWQSLRADGVVADVSRALQVASTSPMGPTWVGLSQDLVEAPAAASPPTPARLEINTSTRPPREVVERVAARLRRSNQPIIIAGADLASPLERTPAHQALIALAEATGAPVFAEDRRGFERTVFPTGHCQYAGLYDITRSAAANADLAVFVGARCFTEFEAPTKSDMPASAHLVHAHSDASEVAKIYGADEAVVCDSLAFVEDLTAAVQGPDVVAENRHLPARREQQAIASRALTDRTSTRPQSDGALTVATVMSILSTWLAESTIVVGDATTSGKALLHAAEQSSATMLTTSSGSLGWGIGAALGVQLGCPGREVVAVSGDGAFQFGLQGLWTAVRYSLPVAFVVINNQSYAAVGAAIRRYAGEVTQQERDLAVDVSGPDMAALAAGFGLQARRVTSADDLASSLEWARTIAGPVLVEVITDPTDLGP